MPGILLLSKSKSVVIMEQKDLIYYTHGGLFHADEVFGYAMLQGVVCSSYKRLTDISSIPEGGIVSDIGREHDPSKNKFDHHQGLLVRNNGYPLASAGLIWQHFYKEILVCLLPPTTAKMKKEIAERVDIKLIQGLDAHDADNQYHLSAISIAGAVSVYSVSNIISMFNAQDVSNSKAQDSAFEEAVELAKLVLESVVRAAHQYVINKENLPQVSELWGEDILIINESMPWRELVHEIYPEVKFVVSKSVHPGNPYSLMSVTVSPSSREVVIPIERPEWFTGFIHQGKWIAGGQSVADMVKLAKHNLEIQ